MAKKSRSPALRRKSQSPAPRAAADPTFRLRGDATAAVDVDPIVVAAVAAACTLACSESGSSLLWDENGTIRSNVLGTNNALKYWPRELQPLFEEDLALPCLNVSMFFYCVYIADKVKGALGPSAQPLHSVVTSLLTAFGGGTIVPLLLGVPVVWLRVGDLFLHHLLPAWCLVNLEAASMLRGLLLDHAAGRALTGSLFGAFRACVIFALIGMARGASVPGGVGFFSLLVCGTLGGCGGILLPFSKGLDPIKDGAPPLMTSAATAAGAYLIAQRVLLPPPEDGGEVAPPPWAAPLHRCAASEERLSQLAQFLTVVFFVAKFVVSPMLKQKVG